MPPKRAANRSSATNKSFFTLNRLKLPIVQTGIAVLGLVTISVALVLIVLNFGRLNAQMTTLDNKAGHISQRLLEIFQSHQDFTHLFDRLAVCMEKKYCPALTIPLAD